MGGRGEAGKSSAFLNGGVLPPFLAVALLVALARMGTGQALVFHLSRDRQVGRYARSG